MSGRVQGDLFVGGDVFADGVSVTDELAGKVGKVVALTDTSASVYALTLDDLGKVVTVSASAGSASVEIPAESSVEFVDGSTVGVAWLGAASAVSVVAASGVTLNSTAGSGSPVALSGQYGFVQLWRTGSDEWLAAGDIT